MEKFDPIFSETFIVLLLDTGFILLNTIPEKGFLCLDRKQRGLKESTCVAGSGRQTLLLKRAGNLGSMRGDGQG